MAVDQLAGLVILVPGSHAAAAIAGLEADLPVEGAAAHQHPQVFVQRAALGRAQAAPGAGQCRARGALALPGVATSEVTRPGPKTNASAASTSAPSVSGTFAFEGERWLRRMGFDGRAPGGTRGQPTGPELPGGGDSVPRTAVATGRRRRERPLSG